MWTTHVDPIVLADYKARHLIKSQNHPRLPLTIWNYSPECQYNKELWDDVTTLCRGLVTDNETNEIVGRSFRKFWNEGEKLYTPTETFTIWEKMDGSLGILFNYKGQWIISSRGSFTSPQAIKAQQMLSKMYNISDLDKDTSYVFEIIFPENRIVIDYGSEEALYFLAAFKKSGEEIFPPPVKEIQQAGFPVCPSYPEYSEYSQLHSLDWANHEGFVIRFSTGERMKIKFENYLELHRTATNLSTTTVYDWFCEKKPLADLLEISPDEFHTWVKEQWTSLQAAHDTLMNTLTEELQTFKSLAQRDFAQAISEHPRKGILFAMRSGKDCFAHICKEIKPVTNEKMQWGPSPVVGGDTPSKHQPQTITILVGISGSGKSHLAKQMLNTEPTTIIVSRDKIREQLFGYEPEDMGRYYESSKLGQKEELVTAAEYAQIEAAAAAGYNVIVDDTNLTQKIIKGFFTRFPDAKFTYKVVECSLKDAIARCEGRTRKVSADVIHSQNAKLIALKPFLEELFSVSYNPICQNLNNYSAIVVDIDGTLALNTGRNPYDWSRVGEDLLNIPVYNTVKILDAANYRIILCSGRSDESRAATEKWLEKYEIPYKSLHMRPVGDQRPDYIVKEEMWRDLSKKYYIEFMLDDRNSVVNHARRLGFTVFQVAPGNF